MQQHFLYGWMGQYEKVHKNGIISTNNLKEFLQIIKLSYLFRSFIK